MLLVDLVPGQPRFSSDLPSQDSIMSSFLGFTARVFFAFSIAFAVNTGAATAGVLFDIRWDDSDTGVVGDGNILGTGQFGYDGILAPGHFSLDTLTDVSFAAFFTSGEVYTLADLDTSLDVVGVQVTDMGGGAFSMIFTGNSAPTLGSADFTNSNNFLLSHEPADSGDVGPALFFETSTITTGNGVGEYIGLARSSAVVPEPTQFAIWSVFGMAGLVGTRRKRRNRNAVI